MADVDNIFKELNARDQASLRAIAQKKSISDAVHRISLFFPEAREIEVYNLVTRLRAEK